MLPAISLGLWHNFGGPPQGRSEADFDETARRMCYAAFDHGITHFDLANNYGPPPGSAEERFGRILKTMPRDELIVATKAGYRMGPGPYGEWGSRKYLLSSLDQSLKRLDMEYVDIFYHHRPDPHTPLEETMGALDQAVRSGKALYAGVSNYNGALAIDAVRTCEAQGYYKPIIDQPNYSMFDRWIERGLLDESGKLGLGVIVFSPLAQGQLSDKYLAGIPKDSRAAGESVFLRPEQITEDKLRRIRALNDLARDRGQSLAQMALAWTLRDERVTSALIGASRPEQIIENAKAAEKLAFTADELKRIDAIHAG